MKNFHLKYASPPQKMVHCGQKLVLSKILGIIFIWVWEFLRFSFFSDFQNCKIWKNSKKWDKWPIFQLWVYKLAKNENHENAHTEMKIMPKILLQTNFWIQQTIFWGGDRFLRCKFFIFWIKFSIVKPAKTRKLPNFERLYLGNRCELEVKWAHSEK